jgi:hypothetical protein
VPYFRSDQYDVKIQALGFVDPAHDVRRFQPKGRNLLLYSSAGRVTAAVGYSTARHLMQMRPLIAAGAPLAQAEDCSTVSALVKPASVPGQDTVDAVPPVAAAPLARTAVTDATQQVEELAEARRVGRAYDRRKAGSRCQLPGRPCAGARDCRDGAVAHAASRPGRPRRARAGREPRPRPGSDRRDAR